MKTQLFYLILFTFISANGFSQSTFTNYFVNNTSNTICDHRIQVFFKDSQDNMWIGTADGASRYDGAGWTTFTTHNGLPSNDVKSIAEDASGNIWFGTLQGIGVYDGSAWTYYTKESHGISSTAINHMIKGPDDIMYIGSSTSHPSLNKGVVRFYEGSFEEVEEINGYVVTDMSLNPVNDDLWFATSVGATFFDGVSWDTLTMDDGLDKNYIRRIDHDPTGDTWLATSNSIYIFNGDTVIRESSNYNLEDMLVTTPFTAWFGTFLNGALYYDGNGVTEYSDNSPIDSDHVSVLYQDTAIWFGTGKNSVSTLKGSNWTRFKSDGLAHHNVNDILEDRDNKILMATRGFGVGIYDRSAWSFIGLEHGLVSNDVVSLMEDSHGNIWIGYGMWSSSVVSKLDGSNWTHYGTADGLSTGDITRILEATNGDIWMIKYYGSLNEDVYRFDGNSWTVWDTPKSPLDIAEDKDGNIWVAMEDGAGVQSYDGSAWTQYADPIYFGTGFNPDYCDITGIVNDQNGDLIFLRSVSDGVRFDGTTFSLVDWYSGGSYSGLADSFGNFWIGTNYGIEKFTGPDWSPGLALGYSTGKVNDIIQTHDGHIWFATENGVTDYIPAEMFPVIGEVNTSDNTCNENNGSIEIIASIGTGADLFFSIDNGNTWSANNLFTGLTAGDYTVKVTDFENVDSASVSLSNIPVQTISLGPDQSICEGDSLYLSVLNTFESYQWNGEPSLDSYVLWAKTGDDYFVEVTDANGCNIHSDTLSLTINPTWVVQETHEICQGEHYIWDGQYYFGTGNYTRHFTSKQGCDSTVELRLTVNPVYIFSEMVYLCEGDTLEWQGRKYSEEGYYTADYTTAQGCDSIYTLTLIKAESYDFETHLTINEGESASWMGNEYSVEGVFSLDYTTEFGCDSIYSLHLTVLQVDDYYFTLDTLICNGDQFSWGGNFIDQAGVYYDNYSSVSGGDSIFKLTVTTADKFYYEEFHNIYQGESYTWRGQQYLATCLYFDSLLSQHGCDSVYALNLTVEQVVDYYFPEDTILCGEGSFVWHEQLIDQPGNYTVNHNSVSGGDSIYEISVTMADPYYSEDLMSICEGESYKWQGSEYSLPGTYPRSYTTTLGCDSTLVLELTVKTAPPAPQITMVEGFLVSDAAIGNQWFLNGIPLQGATGNSLMPEANGDYHVVVIGENSCASAPSNIYNVTTTGLDPYADIRVEVYPNPFEKGVNIKLTGEGNADLYCYLYDLTGNLLVNKLIREGEGYIDIQNHTTGIYMLRIIDGEGKPVMTLKLVKN